MGGNPSSINKSNGDLPDSSGFGNRSLGSNLTAVLMGQGGRSSMGLGRTRQSQRSSPALPVNVQLPVWIQTGTHACYLSKSTKQKIEVVVEMVNTLKCEVEIASLDGVWKVIPFALIVSSQNPLFPPSALPPVQNLPQPELGPSNIAQGAGLQDPVDLTDEVARSRSPKR